MHSRIYQITTSPIELDDCISESDFCEHWFVGSIADFVSSDNDRTEDIKSLAERLKNVAVFADGDTFTILPDGREAYFSDAFKVFAAARDQIRSMGLKEFADGAGMGQALWKMKSAFCEDFSFYVSPDAEDGLDVIPLDEFIRNAEIGTKYYVGGTLDYHY